MLLVVLHGGPGAPGSAVGLAVALAGFGSVLEPWQRRAGSVPLTVDRHVAGLAEVLSSPTVIVGWSWGAMLGLSFAVVRPELVRSLVLVGCGTYDEESRQAYGKRMAERLAEDERTELVRISRQLEATADRPTRDRLFAQMGRVAARAQAVELLEPPAAVEADADGYSETWADVLERQRRGVEPAAFAAISCPVLMIHGADDPHPGPATRDVLRHHLPRLEYIEIPRCGHEPWLERHGREPFLAAVRAWLERLDASVGGEPSRV